MDEPDVSDLITVAQAISILDSTPVKPCVVRVALAEARGLRLAEELAADRDFPAVDKSQMDGFAVRCADVASAPVELRVVGEIVAGSSSERQLQPGEAMAIMTGAPLPSGADGVVPVEETERVGPDAVRVRSAATPGRYIARRGSDATQKQIVLRKGTLIEAAQIAVAASLGANHVQVFRRPRVAVLSTGDELVALDETPEPSQIRNSNAPMLAALFAKLGCDVVDLGVVRDGRSAIRAAIEEGLQHDVLVVTGGMSMGTRDFVPLVIEEDLSFELKVTKLRIKPGKPFVFATRAQVLGVGKSAAGETLWFAPQKYIFGLPGNPVSAFVCSVRLASRLIARLAGGEAREKWLAGKLEVGLPANGPREFYQPVLWSPIQGGTSARSEFATVTPLSWKGSADLFTLAKANALLVRPESEPPLGKGTLVRVLEL